VGYHVAIVRTGAGKPIREDEIVAIVEGKLGFAVERDAAGSIKQVSRESFLLLYDGAELWAKTPSRAALKSMVEIAQALGEGARVRGDEGETYETADRTYTHPDDADVVQPAPRFRWKNAVSLAVPIVAAAILVLGLGAMLVRHWDRIFQ
jgi:hypothetical protein